MDDISSSQKLVVLKLWEEMPELCNDYLGNTLSYATTMSKTIEHINSMTRWEWLELFDQCFPNTKDKKKKA